MMQMIIMKLALDMGLEVALGLMLLASASVSGAVDSVDATSVTGSVPRNDDSATSLASVLGSSTGGVSITQRGVNTDGSSRSVAGKTF